MNNLPMKDLFKISNQDMKMLDTSVIKVNSTKNYEKISKC